MSNMGFILLMSDVDGIVYMILGLFFILTISYGIGCLGRKRKIGFGWAFFISLFLWKYIKQKNSKIKNII